MSFGRILEQVLQQGMAGQSRARLEHSVGPEGLGGVPGLGELLGSVLGGQAGGRSAGGGLGDLFGGSPSGRASSGGLEDLLGGLLGGVTRSAAGGAGGGARGLDDVFGGGPRAGGAQRSGGNPLGSAGMTILATLAMAALKNWSQSRTTTAMGLTGAAASIAPRELETMTAPETERLVLLAMVSAAKADGAVDESEIQRIVGEIDDDGISPAEKQFLVEELRTPLDLQALVEAVPTPAVAAQVYGASLLSMDIDTEAEAAYLRELAAALELDAGTVARLHQLTGAPAV
jgi:uncharacterized membrane protein YebE (DUF533 family)